MTGGSATFGMNGHPAADGRASDLAVAHRICCSSRRSSDWASRLTRRRATESASTASMTPRTVRLTATSRNGRQFAGRSRRKASSIRAWNRSRIGGPPLGKSRLLDSAPSAAAMRSRTVALASRRPASIRPRWVGSMPASRATIVFGRPASSRRCRISAPSMRTPSSARRSARIWSFVRNRAGCIRRVKRMPLTARSSVGRAAPRAAGRLPAAAGLRVREYGLKVVLRSSSGLHPDRES